MRVVRGVPLAEHSAYLDERATFTGQWGRRPSRKEGGPSYEDLVETEGRPRPRMWLERARTDPASLDGFFSMHHPAARYFSV